MSTMKVRKQTGEEFTLDRNTIKAFEETLRGYLVTAEDDEYEDVRAIYNAMITKRPAMFARCKNVADVISAVNFARDNNLLASIRGGGHNGPGLSLCEDGLVIDLSLMKGIRVDPKAQTAQVEPGCTWGDVDHATHAFGLATVSGIISTTGVGGLTLGGGHGYLTRKYGLTIDNLLSADVVLADGSFVTASENEHADLFWALRGGGGNFGVVTSFEFQLHPVDTVVAGPIFWSLDDAKDTLSFYQDYIQNAPDEMYAFFMFMQIPPAPEFPKELHGQNVCAAMTCYAGPESEAKEVINPLRECATPLFEHIGPVPYPAVQSMFDEEYPPGLQWYWKGDFVKELNEEAIDTHIKYASKLPTMHSTMHLYPVNGEANRVGNNDTAFSYREATWSMVIVGVDPDPGKANELKQWARNYWKALHPHTLGASYVNFMMDEGDERVRAAYRDNYPRLSEIKAKYDPDNLFCTNQNIEPKS